MAPFCFYTRVTQVELLGKKARNVKDLLEGIRRAPSSSIYHHTHRFLQQHRYFSPEHPNDFSYWITNALGLRKLGENIASVNVIQFNKIEQLRCRFIEILEDYTRAVSRPRNCIPGEEFHFMSSRIFVIPTPFKAQTIEEFLGCLKRITLHSVYFHVFEARIRIKKQDNDFSRWLKDLGCAELADEILHLDPYTYTIEGLRKKIIRITENYIDVCKRKIAKDNNADG